MRIFTRNELQQELVQIKAAKQCRTPRKRQTASPLGGQQRLQFAGARPRQDERLKRVQQTAKLGARTLRALCDHCNASERRGERLHDETRLTIWVCVENER